MTMLREKRRTPEEELTFQIGSGVSLSGTLQLAVGGWLAQLGVLDFAGGTVVHINSGIAALALTKMNTGYELPMKGSGYNYDLALTTLMAKFYPSGMLGVGITGLMASFMSGMAGNVSAFATVWTYDLYKPFILSGHTLFKKCLPTSFRFPPRFF
jgi:Na+/proline symporter